MKPLFLLLACILGLVMSPNAYADHTASAYCPDPYYPYLETVHIARTGEVRHQCTDDYGRAVPAEYSVDSYAYAPPPAYRPPPRQVVVVDQRPDVVVVNRAPAYRGRSAGGTSVSGGVAIATRNTSVGVAISTRVPPPRRPRVVQNVHQTHVHKYVSGCCACGHHAPSRIVAHRY